MNRVKIRNYDKEFKLNAIKLHLKSGRGFKQNADELGIPLSTLVGWVDEYKKKGEEAFPGTSVMVWSPHFINGLKGLVKSTI